MQHTNTRRGFTQENVNKSCHSRKSLSGIFNACRYKTKKKTLLNGYVEDPRLQTSGMTLNLMSGLRLTYKGCKGFTFIELLVTVLIIAILAAVAVPQYRRAVHKAETAEAYAIMDAFDKAQAAYYLTHGTYEGISPETLDVELPTLKHFKYCKTGARPCASDDPDRWSVLPYLHKDNVGYITYQLGIFNKAITLQKEFSDSSAGEWRCYGFNKKKRETHFDFCSKYVECDSSVSGVSSAGETNRECRVVR